ncbi:MAG: ribose-phosphate pyrophosphokinase [Candidatus Aureabacteria bacterium]|nr:ribose-phosphate pyrophosphokinase [Candidatus Auribacterota bacterium]
MKIFAGNANPDLAEKIAKNLSTRLGGCEVLSFPDGEVMVKILENVRGLDVFVVQPICPPEVNDYLMELLIMIDAMRRSSADRITAVIPYYGYARQDRKDQPRVPITAKLVANLVTAAGADRVLTMDLHADQIQGFFDIPVDHLYAAPVFIDYFKKKKMTDGDVVIISPDEGGIKTAHAWAKRLNANLAAIDKRRITGTETQVFNIMGDVKKRAAIIVDDIVSTAGSLCDAAKLIKERGVKEVYAAISHPVLVEPAVERIENSEIKKLLVTDTIPLGDKLKRCSKIEILSVSGLLAEAIKRIHNGESVSSLFI